METLLHADSTGGCLNRLKEISYQSSIGPNADFKRMANSWHNPVVVYPTCRLSRREPDSPPRFVGVNIHAENAHGFDHSKLKNGIIEPLRRLDLIQ